MEMTGKRSGRRIGTGAVLLGGLVVFGACSTATPSVLQPSSRGTPVAIRTIRNKFLVPVVLNGTQLATFLLDTGASATVITPDLARRLGAEAASGATKARARIASGQEVDVPVVRITSITIGSATVDNLNVAVYELPVMDPSAKPPVTVDGFLGVDVIARFTMTLDPRAGTLTFEPAEALAR
jgi:hypothetical protein